MRQRLLWVVALAMLVLSGCMVVEPISYDFTAYHEAKPRSLLVLPVVNESLDVQAPTYVLTTLPRVLAEKGYYVFPVNTVKTLLEYEGLYEPAEIHARPTYELSRLFGADAVLYLTIHDWTSQYAIISTTTYVDFEYRITDADGQPLWQARKQLSYTPESGESGGGFVDQLLSAAVAAAVERAAPNYLPLTRQANREVFYYDYTAIPPGPYLPTYDAYYEALEAPE